MTSFSSISVTSQDAPPQVTQVNGGSSTSSSRGIYARVWAVVQPILELIRQCVVWVAGSIWNFGITLKNMILKLAQSQSPPSSPKTPSPAQETIVRKNSELVQHTAEVIRQRSRFQDSTFATEDHPFSDGTLQQAQQLEQLLQRIVSEVHQEPSYNSMDGHQRHEKSKELFAEALIRYIPRDTSDHAPLVKFCNAGQLISTDEELNALAADNQTLLDENIFHWAATGGVQHDIPHDAQDKDRFHIYQTASQFNCAEAPRRITPQPGQAMNISEHDFTQGPLAARTNPLLFELTNALLANCGFNMLDQVLSPENFDQVSHGYLSPDDGHFASVVNQFKQNWRNLEQPCITSILPGEGNNPIYLMLAAAPAFGNYDQAHSVPADNPLRTKLQYYAALANYAAQFQAVIELAQQHQGCQVVYHACAVGLGFFGNNPEHVSKGFRHAALAFQKIVQEQNLTNVKVQFEVYHGTDQKALDMVGKLLLNRKERV